MSAIPIGRRAGVVGYAPGVFDLFHVGHLNVLRRARASCDYLIAGVVSDDVALRHKGQRPVVAEGDRMAVVAGMRCVDEVFLECNDDKVISWAGLKFDVIFKGDDWQGTAKGRQLEHSFAAVGVAVAYLPYTGHTSTTILRLRTAERANRAS